MNKHYRQKEAAQRAVLRNDRSNAEQLSFLDKRLGKGVGAKRERARLQKKEKK